MATTPADPTPRNPAPTNLPRGRILLTRQLSGYAWLAWRSGRLYSFGRLWQNQRSTVRIGRFREFAGIATSRRLCSRGGFMNERKQHSKRRYEGVPTPVLERKLELAVLKPTLRAGRQEREVRELEEELDLRKAA